MSVEPIPGGAAAPAPESPRNPLQLIWAALWFNEAAFAEVRDDPRPLRRGLVVVVVVLLVSAVAGAIGLGFDRLTSPAPHEVQQVVLDGIQQLQWYRELASGPGGSEFEQQFTQSYNLWWRIFPLLSGTPTLPGVAAVLCLGPIASLLIWFVNALLTHLMARLLGGQAAFGPALGTQALAVAPSILTVFTILPGLEVAAVTGWWILALTYWAVRSAHGLVWWRNLLAVVLARVVFFVLAVIVYLAASVVLGGVLGALLAGQ